MALTVDIYGDVHPYKQPSSERRRRSTRSRPTILCTATTTPSASCCRDGRAHHDEGIGAPRRHKAPRSPRRFPRLCPPRDPPERSVHRHHRGVRVRGFVPPGLRHVDGPPAEVSPTQRRRPPRSVARGGDRRCGSGAAEAGDTGPLYGRSAAGGWHLAVSAAAGTATAVDRGASQPAQWCLDQITRKRSILVQSPGKSLRTPLSGSAMGDFTHNN